MMKYFIPKWFRLFLQRRYDRKRENALRLLGLAQADLRIISDMKTGQIRLIRSAGFSPHNLGMDIAECTYRGLELLGGTNVLVEYGPKKLLKSARDILNTKALSPIEFNSLLAIMAAYRLSLKETVSSVKTHSIQSRKLYRAPRQRAKYGR